MFENSIILILLLSTAIESPEVFEIDSRHFENIKGLIISHKSNACATASDHPVDG